jgi:hypothetical protein
MHEIESVLISIEELIRPSLYGDSVDLDTGGEGILKNTTVLKISEFGLDKSGALAGLHMLEPYNHARLAVEIEVQSVLKISCCCHIDICFD